MILTPRRRWALVVRIAYVGVLLLVWAVVVLAEPSLLGALLPTLLLLVLGNQAVSAAVRRSRGARLELDDAGIALGDVRVGWAEVTWLAVHRRWPYRALLVGTPAGVHGYELSGWWVPTRTVLAAVPAEVPRGLPAPRPADGEAHCLVRPRYAVVLATGVVLVAGALGLLFLSVPAALLPLAAALLVLALGLGRRAAAPVLRVGDTGLDLRIWSHRDWDVHVDWADVAAVSVDGGGGTWWLTLRFRGADPDPAGALTAAAGLAPLSVADPRREPTGYALSGFAFRPSPEAVVSAARRAAPARAPDWDLAAAQAP